MYLSGVWSESSDYRENQKCVLLHICFPAPGQLGGPQLHSLHFANMPLTLRGPKLNTASLMQPHECQIQEHSHYPQPACYTPAKATECCDSFSSPPGHAADSHLTLPTKTSMTFSAERIICTLYSLKRVYRLPVTLHMLFYFCFFFKKKAILKYCCKRTDFQIMEEPTSHLTSGIQNRPQVSSSKYAKPSHTGRLFHGLWRSWVTC